MVALVQGDKLPSRPIPSYAMTALSPTSPFLASTPAPGAPFSPISTHVAPWLAKDMLESYVQNIWKTKILEKILDFRKNEYFLSHCRKKTNVFRDNFIFSLIFLPNRKFLWNKTL